MIRGPINNGKYSVSVETGDNVIPFVKLPEIKTCACMARVNKDNYSQQCEGEVHSGEFCEKHAWWRTWGRVDQLPKKMPDWRWQNDEFIAWQNRLVDIQRNSVPTSPIIFKGLSSLGKGANDLRTNNLSRKKPVAKKSARKKKRQTPKQKTRVVKKSDAQKRKEARAILSKKRRDVLAAKRKAKQFTSEIYGYRMNELVWCIEKDTFVPHYHWLYVGQTKRGLDVRDKEHRTTGSSPFDLALQSEKYADAEIVLLEKITCRSEEERQRVTDFKEQEWMLKLKTLRKFKVEVFNTVNARHHIQSKAELNENAEKLRQEALIAEELAKRANY